MKSILLLNFIVFILFSKLSVSQENMLNIKGRVVDENNIPVHNAHILESNLQIGTTSDKNGFFQLTIPKRSDS